MISEERFENVFLNNFYTTKSYTNFCSMLTGIKISKFNNFFLLKKKNIAISNYINRERYDMQKAGIKFMAVVNEDNYTENGIPQAQASETGRPSFLEYPVLFYENGITYDLVFSNYSRTVKKRLKRMQNDSDDYDIKTILSHGEAMKNNLLDVVYELYVKQMKRLNSFIFPISFFEEYMKTNESRLFLIYYKHELVAYSFCFENNDNLYASVGGATNKYVEKEKKYFGYMLYDIRVKYATQKKLNFHMGIGGHATGYSKIKIQFGAVCFKCIRNPDDTKMLRKLEPLLKYKVVGWITCGLSKIAPRMITYEEMPFT